MIKIVFGGDLALDWIPGIPLGQRIKKIMSGRVLAGKGAGTTFKSAGISKRIAGAVMSENITRGLLETRENHDLFCLNLESALTNRGRPLAEKDTPCGRIPPWPYLCRTWKSPPLAWPIITFWISGLRD